MFTSPNISYSVSRALFLFYHSPVLLFEGYVQIHLHSGFVDTNFFILSASWFGSFGKKTIVEIKYKPQFSLGNLLRRSTTYTQAIQNY